MGMANPPVFALLNQTRADSGILVRVTPSEFWYNWLSEEAKAKVSAIVK
jgi:hypothetical protein